MGVNLKALRKRAGLSQEEVAARLITMGLEGSREIVSQMELGRYNVRISVLLGLKEIYKATFDEFFAGLSWKDYVSAREMLDDEKSDWDNKKM